MARSVFLLARDLADHGVAPHVVLHRPGRLAHRLQHAGISHDVVPELIETGLRGPEPNDHGLGALARNLTRAPGAVRRLRHIAQRVEADVLYAHGTWSCYLSALAGLDDDAPPVVWHVRNDHSAPLARWTGRTLSRVGRLRGIIAVSAAAARPYVDLSRPIHVIPNGVDVDAVRAGRLHPISRRAYGAGADSVVVGFAGRLVSHKGVGVLMEAFRLACTRSPALHLVVLGENARHARLNQLDRLRRQATAWGLASKVHLPGFVQDIERYLAAIDIVVVPSVCRDACPRTAIEAMALGVPVVASDTGGLPEIVRSGVTGVLVPTASPSLLADALVGLSANHEQRRAMGAAARREGLNRFDSRQTAGAVATVLHGTRRSPAPAAAPSPHAATTP